MHLERQARYSQGEEAVVTFEAGGGCESNRGCYQGEGFRVYFEGSAVDGLDWMWGLSKSSRDRLRRRPQKWVPFTDARSIGRSRHR